MKQDTLAGEKIELVVVEKRCVYLNDYRIAGSKPYVSENLPQHSFTITVGDILSAMPMLSLAALRTDGEANSRAVPSGEAVERDEKATQTIAVTPDGRTWFWSGSKWYEPGSASKPDDASALLKEATKQVAALLREWRAEMPSTAQLIDSIATEWKASGHWSEWDQERREALTKLALATDDLLARIDQMVAK